jgi:GNAT superfamily N-acetyltransferase
MSGRSRTLTIRAAQPRDAPTIAFVLRAAFAEYASRYSPQAYAATTPTSEEIERRLGEGPVWVALLDDAVVGTVSAVPRGNALYIRSLGVVPEARGRSVGSMLLGFVDAYATEHSYACLTLSTTPFLAEAIRLYTWWGFRPSEEGPADLFGTPLFTMTKPLQPGFQVTKPSTESGPTQAAAAGPH